MDPITIGAGISALGSLFHGVTGFFGGLSQASAYRAEAREAQNESGLNAQLAIGQGDQVAARAATMAAANGGGFTGSALGIISQIGQQAMFNARAAVYRGVTQERADLYKAGVAKSDAIDSLVSGFTGAGGDYERGQAQDKYAKAQIPSIPLGAYTAGGNLTGF